MTLVPSVRALRVAGPHGHGGATRIPVFSAVVHAGFTRHVVRQWKYDGRTEWTPWLAGLLIAAASLSGTETGRPRGASAVPGADPGMGPAPLADALVPVPPAPDRLRRRGYDHVFFLAAQVGRSTGIPVLRALERISGPAPVRGAGPMPGRGTSQTGKSRAERRMSQRSAYRLRDGVEVRGKRVLIIDDIVTTGSTLRACAEALAAAGAVVASACVIAREE
ncbi:MAG: hypothetical protein K6T30_00275 [Alicyclobacillus sp.]|nr:hypothetical protein [Alicyclobacillus sp.]